jgi:hypothetical protein
MQKVIHGCGTAFLLALAAGCGQGAPGEIGEPPAVEVRQRGEIAAPYAIEPLDGRVTVDTQRFEVPLPAAGPATPEPPDEPETPAPPDA